MPRMDDSVTDMSVCMSQRKNLPVTDESPKKLNVQLGEHPSVMYLLNDYPNPQSPSNGNMKGTKSFKVFQKKCSMFLTCCWFWTFHSAPCSFPVLNKITKCLLNEGWIPISAGLALGDVGPNVSPCGILLGCMPAARLGQWCPVGHQASHHQLLLGGLISGQLVSGMGQEGPTQDLLAVPISAWRFTSMWRAVCKCKWTALCHSTRNMWGPIQWNQPKRAKAVPAYMLI